MVHTDFNNYDNSRRRYWEKLEWVGVLCSCQHDIEFADDRLRNFVLDPHIVELTKVYETLTESEFVNSDATWRVYGYGTSTSKPGESTRFVELTTAESRKQLSHGRHSG